MYSENPAKDAFFFARAILSNQLARFAPSLFLKLTGETGRGRDEGTVADTAAYFLRCFRDYLEQLDINDQTCEEHLKGKTILEYGPGDTLGVALLLYAHGAQTVHCVDRFPLVSGSPRTVEVYRAILESLKGQPRARADRAFREEGKPESGFDPNAIAYSVTPDGLSGREHEYDLVLSRAVLEHVNNLQETLRDAAAPSRKTASPSTRLT